MKTPKSCANFKLAVIGFMKIWLQINKVWIPNVCGLFNEFLWNPLESCETCRSKWSCSEFLGKWWFPGNILSWAAWENSLTIFLKDFSKLFFVSFFWFFFSKLTSWFLPLFSMTIHNLICGDFDYLKLWKFQSSRIHNLLQMIGVFTIYWFWCSQNLLWRYWRKFVITTIVFQY